MSDGFKQLRVFFKKLWHEGSPTILGTISGVLLVKVFDKSNVSIMPFLGLLWAFFTLWSVADADGLRKGGRIE